MRRNLLPWKSIARPRRESSSALDSAFSCVSARYRVYSTRVSIKRERKRVSSHRESAADDGYERGQKTGTARRAEGGIRYTGDPPPHLPPQAGLRALHTRSILAQYLRSISISARRGFSVRGHRRAANCSHMPVQQKSATSSARRPPGHSPLSREREDRSSAQGQRALAT